jgi:hypothetical protein
MASGVSAGPSIGKKIAVRALAARRQALIGRPNGFAFAISTCPCFEKAGRSSIIWLRFVNWSGEVGCQFPSHCLPRSGFVSAFRIDALSRGGGEAGSRKLGEDRLRHLCCNLGEGRQRCAAGGGVPSMLPKWFVFAISPNAVRIMFPYFLDYLASFGNFLQIARSVSPGRFLCRADD